MIGFYTYPGPTSHGTTWHTVKQLLDRTHHNEPKMQQDPNIAYAEQYLRDGDTRDAGQKAGIALEFYIRKLCDMKHLPYPRHPKMQVLIDKLENASVITPGR